MTPTLQTEAQPQHMFSFFLVAANSPLYFRIRCSDITLLAPLPRAGGGFVVGKRRRETRCEWLLPLPPAEKSPMSPGFDLDYVLYQGATTFGLDCGFSGGG
jgi:hypothetical protein